MNDRKKKVLQDLCSRNGRAFCIDPDGTIYTIDKYEGTDGQSFPDMDAAINWEAGYITAGSMAGRERRQ